MNNNHFTIAIADDHQLIRKAICNIITTFDDCSISIEASDGSELIKALEQAEELPDVCIIDISMRRMNGFDTLAAIRNRWPQMKVLILTIYAGTQNINKAFSLGANGYLLKDCNPDELFKAIKDIVTNGIYTSDLVPYQMIHHIRADKQPSPRITDREAQFLSLCCSELTYNEIAGRMGISLRTVDTYRESLFGKLHVTSRTGLVMQALQTGIVQLQ